MHKHQSHELSEIQKRRFKKLRYHDPDVLLRSVLPDMRKIQGETCGDEPVTKARRRTVIESYQAGLLALILQLCMGPEAELSVSMAEQDDFDCVIRGKIFNGSPNPDERYIPVQLKELPNDGNGGDKNRRIGIQEMLNKLKRHYPSSQDLVVAIWVNRDCKVELDRLDFVGLNIAQLWVFGQIESGITIHGGLIEDWLNGKCREGRLDSLEPQYSIRTFKQVGADAPMAVV